MNELFTNYTLKMLKADSIKSLKAYRDRKAAAVSRRLQPVYDRTKGTLTSLLAVAALFVVTQAMA